MNMKLTYLAAAAMVALVPSVATAAPTVYFSSNAPGVPSIMTSGQNDSFMSQFFRTFYGSTVFDDVYSFTASLNGTQSASISTSFSSASNKLTFTDFLVNGVSYGTSAFSNGQSNVVGGINVIAGAVNTIEIKGIVKGSAGYSGTSTFAAAVPEPATWALMIVGFGLVGGAMRNRTTKETFNRRPALA